MSCVFCSIVAGDAPAELLHAWPDALAITPLNPVTPGHALVLPRIHVRSAVDDPIITGAVMARAAEYALNQAPCNIITSVGSLATQTVFHLHVHVVPRRAGDGLALPWTGREAS